MDLPDLNNLTPEQQAVAARLERLTHMLPVDGLQFVAVGSDTEMLAHIFYKLPKDADQSTERAKLALRLRRMADHLESS